jgi:gliding motility-associated-like protein
VFPIGSTTLSYTAKDPSSNSANCSFTITVLDFPSIATIVVDSISLCQGFSTSVEALPVTSGQGKWSSFNSNQVTFNDQEANLTKVNNLNFGVNTLLWTISSATCGSLTDTMNVYIYQKPLPASTLDTVLLCNEKMLNLTANVSLYGIGTWTTDKGAIIKDKTLPKTTATDLANGWNRFIWKIVNGSCPSTSDTMNVFRATTARINQSDTSLCLESNQLELSGILTESGESSEWSFIYGNGIITEPHGNQTSISDFNAGINRLLYTVSSDYCSATSDTLVILSNFCDSFKAIFPTVITPNLDGKNDLFKIHYLNEIYPTCRVTIFNRWGTVVFESNGYADPWDGTFNNEDLPMGTYFYKIELYDKDKTVYNGPISIIR